MSDKKVIKLKASNSNFEAQPLDDGSFICIARRRQTRKDTKAGIKVDTEAEIIRITIGAPDKYQVVDLTIDVLGEVTTTMVEEYINYLDSVVDSSKVSFYRIPASCMENDTTLKQGLEKTSFVQDPNNTEWYERERPLVNYMALYMSLGLSIGMVFGFATNLGLMVMPIGMCIGMAIGAMLDSGNAKTRKALKESRGNTFTTTVDEDGEPVEADE